MYITTSITWDIETGKVLEQKGYEYDGPVAECKGATQQQKDLAQSQTNFYNQLASDYNTQFANQSAILSALNKSLSPIIQGGPSQFGYSNGEVNALNSNAIENTGRQYNNAQKTLQNQQAVNGGQMALPSGVNAQNNATLASNAANQASDQLLGIQRSGYEQGNQNYNNALSAELGVSGQYNPTGFAGQATGAGSAAGQTDSEIQKANAAASPFGAIGGLLGGLGGAFLGPIGSSIGKGMGGGSSSVPAWNPDWGA